jgi:hypothetical protein
VGTQSTLAAELRAAAGLTEVIPAGSLLSLLTLLEGVCHRLVETPYFGFISAQHLPKLLCGLLGQLALASLTRPAGCGHQGGHLVCVQSKPPHGGTGSLQLHF